MADEGVGHWVTIDGTHVYIRDGRVAAGPASLQGRTLSEAHEHVAAERDKQAKYHRGQQQRSEVEGDTASADYHRQQAEHHEAKAAEIRDGSHQTTSNASEHEKAPTAPRPDGEGIYHKTANGRVRENQFGGDHSIEYRMSDGPYAGQPLREGVPAKAPSGEPIVKFAPIRQNGKTVTPAARIEGRPELRELHDKHAELTAQKEARSDWRPTGTDEIGRAHSAVNEAERKTSRAIENDGMGGFGDVAGARERLANLRAAHPRAAAWHDAESQQNATHWSDPTGAAEAAENAKEILRNGGSAEEARKALSHRRDVDPLSLSAGCYALELQADGGGKAVPLALEGAPTVDDAGQQIHYRRALIAKCRDWTHRGSGEPFTITRARADEWIRNTAALAAAGVKPFVPGEHREKFNAADNHGYVERIERDGDDVYAIVALHGDEALKLAARNGRSIYVVKDAIDASGKVYPGESLHHLALVPNPALPNLGGTLKIAASADGGTVRDVPVFVLSAASTPPAPQPRRHKMKAELAAQVRAKFGFGPDVPDDQLDDKAAERALALSADVETLTKDRDAKAKEVLALSADKHEPDALSLSLISKAFKNEEAEVIRSGVLSQAGVEELRKLYYDGGKPTREALALSAGSSDPKYSRLLDVIKRFPGVKSNADRGTPAEPLALSADDQQKANEKIAKDAKEQAEAYKKEQLAARGLSA